MSYVQHYTFTPYEAPEGNGSQYEAVRAAIAGVNAKVEAELKRNNGRLNFLNNTEEYEVDDMHTHYGRPSKPPPVSLVYPMHPVQPVVPKNIEPTVVIDVPPAVVIDVPPAVVIDVPPVQEANEYHSPCSIICMSLLSLVMSIPILYIGYQPKNLSQYSADWIKGSGFSLVVIAAYTPLCFCLVKLYRIFLFVDLVVSCVWTVLGIAVMIFDKERETMGIVAAIYIITNGLRYRCRLVSTSRGGIVEEN